MMIARVRSTAFTKVHDVRLLVIQLVSIHVCADMPSRTRVALRNGSCARGAAISCANTTAGGAASNKN
jgi:hypothetical protein